MDSDEKNSGSKDIQNFLKDNFPILALIGVFAAVAKYFANTDSSPNDAIIFYLYFRHCWSFFSY